MAHRTREVNRPFPGHPPTAGPQALSPVTSAGVGVLNSVATVKSLPPALQRLLPLQSHLENRISGTWRLTAWGEAG